jgi:PHS family inorganic phosphate transporter-like MFS transporter
MSSNYDYSKVLISGAGFLADAYDLFVINIAVDLMAQVHYESQSLSLEMRSLIKSMTIAGAIIGQIVFGFFADILGRRIIFIVTCSLVIAGSLLAATVMDSWFLGGIYNQLCVWCFLLGIGIGGEYPLSASITSESSEENNRIENLAMVFSMQGNNPVFFLFLSLFLVSIGLGTILSSLVLVIITQSMGSHNYNAQWRIALGLGALPMIFAFYPRWKMTENPNWKGRNNNSIVSNHTILLSSLKSNDEKNTMSNFCTAFDENCF